MARVIRTLNWLAPGARQAGRWLQGASLRCADLLFPPVCLECHAAFADVPQNGILLCEPCRLALPGVDRVRCNRCGSPLPQPVTTSHESIPVPAAHCRECAQHPSQLAAVFTLGDYEGTLRASVLRMKLRHEEPLTAAMATLLWQQRGAAIQDWQPDAVAAIPMHWTRRLRRGVNSPTVIGSLLAGYLKKPAAHHLMVRQRRTRPQGHLIGSERLKNVKGALRVRSHPDLAGARVLLVDDVLTTGATSNEAARALLKAGAAAVAIAVIARASGLE